MRIRLGIPLTARTVASTVHGRLAELAPTICFSYLSTDTRELCSGDLFIPLKGEKFDGEDFLDEVKAKGAIPLTTKEFYGSIRVQDIDGILLILARYYKSLLKDLKHTVAITGSVGKTTTKELTKSLLEHHFKVHATMGNFNNKIGLPLTVLSSPVDTEILILEMGMNHEGEISELSKCVAPTVAVITNIGSAHIGNLGSRENIAKAKLEITDGMQGGRLILPYGEPLLPITKNAVTFSSKTTESDVYIIYNEGNCVAFDGCDKIRAGVRYVAPHLVECLAAAVAVCRESGLRLNALKDDFSSFFDKNIRQNIIYVNKTAILSDYYNASLESVSAALDYLCNLKEYEYKSALLGDVLELGDKAKDIHRAIGKKCGELGLRSLYLFGGYSDYTADGALSAGMSEERIYKNPDLNAPNITADQIYRNSSEKEIVLFKASHAIDLGRVLTRLKEYR